MTTPLTFEYGQQLTHALGMEPLARIMYGQRELFHSNLLAWFFESQPEAADEVFKPFAAEGTGTERAVHRERQHIDLVFTWQDRAPLVLENKVFSLPDPAQFQRYDEQIAGWQGSPPARVLLSMAPPMADTAVGWTYLNYSVLADRILDVLSDAAPSYETQTMQHYAQMIKLLAELIETTELVNLAEEIWLPAPYLAGLDSNQLSQTLEKMRGHRVALAINATLSENGGRVDAHLSHGRPLLTWRRYVTIDSFTVEVGLQLQDGQLRRYMTIPHLAGRDDSDLAARVAFANAHSAHFDFEGLAEILDVRELPVVPASGEYRRFNPDFVYRYAKVPTLRVDQLIAAIRWADR